MRALVAMVALATLVGFVSVGVASAVVLDVPSLDLPDAAPKENHYLVGVQTLPSPTDGEFHGAKVVQLIDGLNIVVVETDDYAGFHREAMADSNVRYVEWADPRAGVADFVPNDTKYNDAGHWGSKKIGAETAWDKTLGSTSIKVAMIDSGLNKGHEEYSGQSRVLQGYDFVSNDNNPQDTSGCSWHGTHTTGTAGATINNGKGIAGMSQHSILPIRAFSNPLFGCTAGTTALVNSLKFAGDQGAHISSNSWGGGGGTSINDAITYAHNKGTIHVAAAGNGGPCTNCVSEPWKTKASIVIVVSSTTSTDAFSSFSSEGAQVDVAAPGSSILSTTSGTNTYGTLSGTSMATPHVAGTAGLIKARNPTWGFTNVENQLRNTAKDLGSAGFDNKFGYGRIQANLAVT